MLAQNIRDIVIGVLAFLLWGWSGLAISFFALFALNIVIHIYQIKIMEALND